MKPANRNLINTILVLVLMSTLYSSGQGIIQKDIYGRVIIDSTGKKINYTRSDTIPITQNQKSTIDFLKSANSVQSNCIKDTVTAKVENLYSVMGTLIGRNSMHSIDIDGDSIVELICTASIEEFWLADYWYIMRYNSNDNSCNQVWTSAQYSNKISALEVVDFDNDENYKIILGFKNGSIQVYDGKTRNLIKEVNSVNERIYSIIYADADNDSKKDIVISCEYNTYVLDSNSLLKKFTITQGANCVRVGNINNDSLNEIVLSTGTAYQIKNSVLNVIWRFSTTNDGLLELSDIDGDLMQELIFAEPWYKIQVYDADLKTTKYTINTQLDIDALCLKDFTNDGVDDIIYGDAQWGDIICYDAVTRSIVWRVKNPDSGVSAINVADLNNDGAEELIWGAGSNSTASDYLYIYNVSENKLIWRSDDIVGPFYAVAKGDVDNDGIEEIVAISYLSESAYGSGILIIIDSQTNKIKWKSNKDFLFRVWRGNHNVSIKDIDNDGFSEILIAAGYLYTGEIWIIDGKNYTIKSSHIFTSDNISEFYSLAVEDIDNDGKLEFIAGGNSMIYAINPTDWAIKWRVNTPSNYLKPIIRCADINGDLKKETIVCKGSIQVINGADQSFWTSQETNYLNIDTYDFNSDGVLDIVASTTDGHIRTFDGKTKTVINDLNPETTEISSVRIKKNSDSVIYIYSCDGRINFYKNDSNCIVTQFFGPKIGEIEGLKIFDDKSDASTVVFGTSISVLEIPGNLANCLEFDINVNISEPSCDKDDGKILLNVSGGTAPYKYLWNDNSDLDSLSNLIPGNYSVKISDSGVCVKNKYINLPRASIDAYLQVIDEGCSVKGSAKVILNHINEPYSINWSNSQTGTEITNLTADEYHVVVNDSKNCRYEEIANVKKDTVIMSAYIKNVTCNGHSDGSVYLSRISGKEPLNYEWNDGGNLNYLGLKKAGNYNVTVSDALGCTASMEFEITEPNEIKYDILTSPDDLSNPVWEGKIMIENISGGTSPYQVYWPRFSKYGDYLEVLPPGKYGFILTDNNNCQAQDTAIISSVPLSVKSIDVSATIVCEGDPVELKAHITGGKPPYYYTWSEGSKTASVIIYPTETTTYKLTVTDANSSTATYDVKIRVKPKPEPPIITIEGDTLVSNYSSGNIWMVDGEIINNAISKNLIPERNGRYSLKVMIDGCISDLSNTVFIGAYLTLHFKKGWNIFSIPIQPGIGAVDSIFKPMIENNAIVKIQDEDGNALEDWGIFGGWTNGIGNINPTEGYKIKMNLVDSIEISGSLIKYPFAIPLKSGWNIIGYPHTSAFDGMGSIVKQLIDKGLLIKVQDDEGNSIEDWGIFGGWTNGIGDFIPCEGYKIKVSTNDTLWIYESYEKSTTVLPQTVATTHFLPEFEGKGVDHMNFNLVGLPFNILKAGDELAIFDGTTCVGAVTILPQHLKSQKISITASAADNQGMAGFIEGNPITLKLWKSTNKEEFKLEPEIVKGASTFVKHETTVASLEKYAVTGLEGITGSNIPEINCYPNPFGDKVTIEIKLEDNAQVQLEVMNQLGQRVKIITTNQILPGGLYKFEWNGTDASNQAVSTGIYYLRVNINGKEIHKKIVYSK